MSQNNGVIRIGRKGIKEFAFGEEGKPFKVDVVSIFQEWILIDASFRQDDGDGAILGEDMAAYHTAAVDFANKVSADTVTIAEALDFLARLREQYDELVVFFQPRSPERRASPGTSEEVSAVQFSAEES